MIAGSLFNNVRDNQPWPLPPVSFAELITELRDAAWACKPSAKEFQTCISPATYSLGKTRAKAEAISWNWFAADIDNKLGNIAGSAVDDIITVMDSLGSAWFIYTTASSQPSAECFRVMFPLDRPILNGEFDIVWQAFSRLLPMDPQTKDISRLFIVPRHWQGRDNRCEMNLEGPPVSVDSILERHPPPTVVCPVPRRPVAATNFRPISIRPALLPSLDAPYVPPKAIEDALSAPQGGRMYGFLLRVAFQALRMGHDISPHDLEVIGNDLATMMGRNRADIRRDAQSAHRYAADKHIDDHEAQFGRMQAALRPKSLGIL